MTFRKHLAVFLGLTLGLVCCYTPPVFATVSNTTVSTTTALGDGVTTNFVIGFDFRHNSWINVVRHDNADNSNTTIAQGSGSSKFTVSGGDPGTTVVMGTAPTTTQYLVITRNIPLTQTVAFSPSGVFPYSGLSSQLDQVTLSLQNLNAGIGGSSGGGGAVGGSTLPSTGVAYDFIGWNSSGTSTVNYPGSTVTLSTNDILKYTGSGWTNYNLTGANIASLIDGQSATQIAGSAGGTGVNNGGNLTYGSHNLTFSLSGDTTLTLPTSGTLLTGTTNTGNVSNTLVLRDSLGNFSASTITAASGFSGNLTGSVTGNVTGNVSGTALSVTGTTPIGHGGTGQTTQQAAINALTGSQTSGYFLRSNGTNASLQPIGIGDVPQGFSRLKLAQDTANTLVVNDGSGNMSVLPGINAGDILEFNGIKWVDASAGTILGANGFIIASADTGTANHYILTPGVAVTSYSLGMTVMFNAANANTTSSDINVSGIGVVPLLAADGGALTAGDILAGQMVAASYDGANFQLVSQQGPATSTITNNAIVKRDTSGSVLGHASLDLRATNNLSDVSSAQTGMNNLAQAVTSGLYLRGDGVNVQMSTLKAADMTGQIAIANGGTGQATQQLALNALAGAVTSGRYLRGDGTNVQMSAILATDLSGITSVTNGGTGLSAITLHDLVVGNGTTALTLLAPNATSGIPLISKGTGLDPAYGTVVVGGGGTGNTSFTANQVLLGGTTTTGVLQQVAGGTSGLVLTSNGTTSAPTWQAAAVGNQTVTSQSTVYSILTTDNLVINDASSAAYTETLPTAVGVTGKQYILSKGDSTLNFVTVTTTSSQAIKPGGTTTHLSTQGEVLSVMSDGTQWQTVNRSIPSNAISYTPTLTGFGTATSVTFWWERNGKFIHIWGLFSSGTVAGSGFASISLPSGLTIDQNSTFNGTTGQNNIGVGWMITSVASQTLPMIASTGTDATQVYMGKQLSNAAPTAPATPPNSYISSSAGISVDFTVPVSGWAN